jgi:hypothetical protein
VEGHTEPCGEQAHNHKAGEPYIIEVFRIKKQVRNPQILSKIAGDHGEQKYPAQNQNYVSPDIIKEKLNRKRIDKFGKKKEKLAHRQNSISSYAINYRS